MTIDASPHVPDELGDFTATPRMLSIAGLAIAIGAMSAVVALALLRLIGLFTNLFFYQRLSTAFVSPAQNRLGLLAALVPVAGGLIIGVMARYGSDRIRGHGIPEALEAILTRGSRVEPKVALLKPISAAISIGSGGPFGAEGPIIMTGGAFGSMIAQLFHLTAAERKTLLVAGAAAGMSATFSAPIASVLLAVELLLFELKPRSFVPVSLASATAMLVRVPLLGAGPLFSVPSHRAFVGASGLAASIVVGLLAGSLAWLMTRSVYASEDLFKRLPLHWMWWPALGGIVVGVGGLIYPRALGVGYDTIEALLRGTLSVHETLQLVVVKWTIWAIFLGSGTSGGVLAPLLMIGSALGGLAAPWLPDEGTGFWPLVAMGAVLGGTMRSPLTGVVFATELTGDRNVLLPLLVASTVAHAFTVLTMRRSILTEKVARRGFHVSREYAIDPLEVLFARDVMQTALVELPASQLDEISAGTCVIAHPDETLTRIVHRMAESGHTELPVVARHAPGQLVGLVTLTHLLEARRRHLEEERRRERVLRPSSWLPTVLRPAAMRAARAPKEDQG
ncbi:MAG: chloride channel protein [Polyangiales bacterium]